MPYYGLVTAIEDRHNHRIEIDHCVFRQRDFNNSNPFPDCQDCLQNCAEKGQVRTVKLISGYGTPNETVVWTLVYVHRGFHLTFGGSPPVHLAAWFEPDGFRWLGMNNAVHSIHVYEGDVQVTDHCLTLGWTPFSPGSGVESLDDIDAVCAVTELSLPDEWTYEIKYMYMEPNTLARLYPTAPNMHLAARSCPYPYWAPRLIKSTKTTRSDAKDSDTVDIEYTIYRYRHYVPRLHLVLSNETLRRIIDVVDVSGGNGGPYSDGGDPPPCSPSFRPVGGESSAPDPSGELCNTDLPGAETLPESGDGLSVNDVIKLGDADSVLLYDPITGEEEWYELQQVADITYRHTDASSDVFQFTESDPCFGMVSVIGLDATRLRSRAGVSWGTFANVFVDRRGPTNRYYRLHRFEYLPVPYDLPQGHAAHPWALTGR